MLTPASPVKIVLLGDGAVGKSSLVIRLVQDRFVDEYDPTVEESFSKTLQISGEEVRLQIMDTAGQDDFSAIRQATYREAEGVCCVFDVTRPESFEKMQIFWEELANERLMNGQTLPPCVCVGNKIDLHPGRVMLEEQVWARSIDAPLILTSASSGEGVDQVFLEITSRIRAGQLDLDSDANGFNGANGVKKFKRKPNGKFNRKCSIQ